MYTSDRRGLFFDWMVKWDYVVVEFKLDCNQRKQHK